MHLVQFFAFEQPGPTGGGKRRILRIRNRIATIVCAASLLVLFASVRPALATVQTSGIVYAYSGSPRVYGLPFFGNDVDYDPFFPNDETFEYDAVAGPNLPGGDLTTLDNQIVVGKGARGDLVISGSSILRAEHLIIGDVTTVGNDERGGLGIVRVTGFASTYNNNPDITELHPSVLEVPMGGTAWGGTIRTFGDGYDMFIGAHSVDLDSATVGGVGELHISAGGSVENQDSFVLAAHPFTRATLTVDGVDSSLTTGGFTGNPTVADPKTMIIGRRGIASMTISTGGSVISEAPLAAPIKFGASIGSLPYADTAPPDINQLGGQGTVTVTGVDSNWIIGGSLQIGGFHDASQTRGASGPDWDIEGNDVEYNTEIGAGTLRVLDGGFVSIRNPLTPRQQGEELRLAIGQQGRLDLLGGHVTVGDTGGDPTNGRDEDIQLINDGTVTGAGRIDTGVFHNRLRGQVRVNPGQSLTIAATSLFNTSSQSPQDEPLLNFGLIEVIGTPEARAELEFERPPGTTPPPPDPDRPLRRLINRLGIPVVTVPPGNEFNGGMIVAQDATLNFETGVFNEGIIAFTAGTNIVKGALLDRTDTTQTPAFNGRVIFGQNTTTIFEEEFSPIPGPPIPATAQIIQLDPGTITLPGLNKEIGRNPNPIIAAGDMALSGPVNLTLLGDVVADLLASGPTTTIPLINFGGTAYSPKLNSEGFWEPDYSAPLPNCITPGVPCGIFTTITPPDLGPLFANHIPVTQRINQSIVLSFVNLASIGVTLLGDYNNDGVVDAADYIVWRKNEGTMNMLPNDPFGGTIGQNQYDAWRGNFGETFPGSGAGSGLGANVPEPTALALLVSGGMLALALRRQRLR
ncbi:MAG: PEP-CTERM sorting domain-containing protein [Pirellulales bacterium]